MSVRPTEALYTDRFLFCSKEAPKFWLKRIRAKKNKIKKSGPDSGTISSSDYEKVKDQNNIDLILFFISYFYFEKLEK